MSGTSSARRKLMPYRYRRSGIDCEIRDYELDGEAYDGPIERQRQFVDVTRKPDWDSIRLNLELDVPTKVVKAVVPDAEHDDPPVALIAVVRCGATYLRRGKVIATGPVSESHTTGVTLDRDDLRDRMTLTPYLVRTTDGRNTDGYAHDIGNHLAADRSWEVAIDPDDSSGGGYLNVEFDSFAENDYGARQEQVYHLRTSGAEPTLYLNSDHEDVRSALENDAPTGGYARVRDVAYDVIGSGVWTELFVSAASDVNENGEGIYDWQTGVLEFLLEKMYPDRDMGSALTAVRAGIQDGENPSEIFNRLNVVLQTEADNRSLEDHLTKLIGEVE